MADAAIVKAGVLACSHAPGAATISTVSKRLSVSGAGVLLAQQESGLDFSGCINKVTVSPFGPAPCISQAASAGAATKLTVGGTPVLLASAKGTTTPKATPAAAGTWKVQAAGQKKLTAA